MPSKDRPTLEAVSQYIRTLVLQDETLQSPNNCRASVQTIEQQVHLIFPTVQHQFLVAPEASNGEYVHYAIQFFLDDTLLVNMVSAPGFPMYIGNKNMAHPFLVNMKTTDKVV